MTDRRDDEPELVSMEELIPGSETAQVEPVGAPAPRNWDFLLSTFLIVILIAQSVLFVALSITFGVRASLCVEVSAACNFPVIMWSGRAVLFAVPVIAIAAVVVAIVRLVRRRHAWWILAIAMVVDFGIYLVASWLVDQSIP